jgi:Flp pilus assembly protein TadD
LHPFPLRDDLSASLRPVDAVVRVSSPRWRYLKDWLTVVYFRLGQLTNAIATLEAAVQADQAGGTAYDFLFLAMAHHRAGDAAQARDYFTKATNWVAQQPKLSSREWTDVESFRAEAEAVLSQPVEKISISP